MIGRVISGRSVGRAMQQAAARVREHQDQCHRSLQKLDESSTELVDRRGQTLLELAQHYLPEVSRESVLASFRGIRSELLDVLKRKQHRERQLDELLQQDEAAALQLQKSLEETTDRLNEKVAEREKLEAVVAERLKQHAEFQSLSQQALAAEQELERNEQRIAEIQQEASEKLPAYEKSRLFRYLYDRDYGTGNYKKRGLTKQLDRWIAKLVKYDRSRRSYDFLRVTPELMAAEVTRRRDQFNQLMEQLEAIEDQISLDEGLTQVLRAGEELGERRDELMTELAELERQFNEHHQELLALEGTQNEFYEQGVQRMRDFLAEMEHSWLEHQSDNTPQRHDDELVAEIGWLDEQLDRVRRESSQLTREQREWEDRAEGLQEIRQRFRQADYDSRRSQFSAELDVDRLVSDFLHGKTGREEVWSILRRFQRFQQPRYEMPGPGWHVEGSWGRETMGGVLGRVLIEVAGEAMKHAVRRGMERRGPSRRQYRQRSGLPDLDGWFTRGKGF